MGRSLSLCSILLAAALPAACSFSKASEGDLFPDGSAPVDVNVPNNDGGGGLISDAMVTCAEANPQTKNLPPDVLIVLDRSGSMNEDLDGNTCMGNAGCGANSKWSIATMTLASYLPTVETTVNWGLKLFASPTGNSCSVSNGADVAPKTMNAAAITQRLSQTTAGSSTPTTAAMNAAATYLKGLNDGNPKFILLATDGIPTCGMSMCAAGVNTGGSTNQCDDANAIAAVKSVHDNDGIPTFVLGIGTANSPGDGTLSQMAVNGGFPRNGTPSYYPIGSADDLTQAFQSITQTVGQCFFSVTPALGANQAIGGVSYDGGTIPQDATNGYSIVGQNGIQLNGQSCDDFMSGKIKDVRVLVDCNG